MSDEPEELVRFREAWKVELERRRAQPSTSTGSNAPRDQEPSTHDVVGSGDVAATLPTSAIEIYRRAVQHEQQSQLDDALRLYRQAFRMDPDIDKAYHRHEHLSSIASYISAPKKPLKGEAEMGYSPQATTKASTVTRTLASIMQAFPRDVGFEPEDERKPIPIKSLPDELLILILRKLDPFSMERFACVSRKARIMSLDSTIWRELFEIVYRFPQIPSSLETGSILDRYFWDYRRAFVEHPRVRTDGVYISTCKYIRDGLSDNAWIHVSHLVTYYRYLRFLSTGQVLALLVNEEHSPQEIIPHFQRNSSMKGMSIGTWELQGTSITIRTLLDAAYLTPHMHKLDLDPLKERSATGHSLPHPSHSNHLGTHSSLSVPRYNFQMLLELRSRPLGRWNKLELKAYESVVVDSGEICGLSLKNERNFWFTRVKSWGW